ncbi:MAG: hypothetical protein ACR2IK_06900 [Chloroflexota bacterium]
MSFEDCTRISLPVARIDDEDRAAAFGLPLDVDEPRGQEFVESDCSSFGMSKGCQDRLARANRLVLASRNGLFRKSDTGGELAVWN